MPKSFDEIYSLYNRDLYRLIYSYVLNKFDSEDIMQRTFYKLYKNKKILYLPNEEIKKWLFKVSINEAKDLLKSPWKKRYHKLDENLLDNKAYHNNKSVINALKNIPPNYRIPLYLYYYEGYNVKEIALIIKKSSSAVKMRLSRGKEMLKQEMEVL